MTDRFLIIAIDALHLSHLQPNALSTICSQHLIFGIASGVIEATRGRMKE
jgi:hypothetical protein